MEKDNSLYCYNGTDVLINKFNIKDQELLSKVEADLTNITLMKLEKNPLKGNFDLKHLQSIHSTIFKDIYPFAGVLRNENIAKGNFMFASAMFLKDNAIEIFNKLKKENYLQGKTIDEFVNRAAYYMSEINVLHPFREGNGRSQREYIRTLAAFNGYKINWRNITKDEMLRASINSVVNTTELSKVIRKSIENEEPIKELKNHFKNKNIMERS